MQIARRIEEVRAEKMLAEFGRIAFGDLRQRNAAGVGGDDGAGRAMRDHPVVERALDGEVFGDGFDDPVAVCDLREVVVEVAGGDEAGGFGNEERGRAAFERGFDAIARGLIATLRRRTISSSSDGICALARCAAMREPMVPAPRTATRRIGFSFVIVGLGKNGPRWGVYQESLHGLKPVLPVKILAGRR